MTTPLRSCGTCGLLTLDRCDQGHALCQRCQEELNACEVCSYDVLDEEEESRMSNQTNPPHFGAGVRWTDASGDASEDIMHLAGEGARNSGNRDGSKKSPPPGLARGALDKSAPFVGEEMQQVSQGGGEMMPPRRTDHEASMWGWLHLL